jgi:hypothetical protein
MKGTLLSLVAGTALIAATLAGSAALAAPHGGGGGGGHIGGGGGFGGGGGGMHIGGGGGFGGGGAGLRGGGAGFGAGAFRGASPMMRGTVGVGPITRGPVGVGRPGFARRGVTPGTRFAPGAVGTRFAQAGRGHWVFDRHHHRHFVRGAFFGFAAGFPYWDDYYYDSCWVRQLGAYGWVWVNVCDPYYSYY